MVSYRDAAGPRRRPRKAVAVPHRAVARFQNRVQPKVYTIAPHRPFLATLAAGLLGMAGTDPLQLPRITVLLPTRRAVRSVRDAFLRVAPEGNERSEVRRVG